VQDFEKALGVGDQEEEEGGEEGRKWRLENRDCV
jgi:hypothetical protein